MWIIETTKWEDWRRGAKKKKAQLLAGRENDPGRVELRRQDLSGIFDGHPSEGGNGGGELGALGGPGVLAADEAHYDGQAHNYSDHHSENEAHREKRETREWVNPKRWTRVVLCCVVVVIKSSLVTPLLTYCSNLEIRHIITSSIAAKWMSNCRPTNQMPPYRNFAFSDKVHF